jgi:hypothetical protein
MCGGFICIDYWQNIDSFQRQYSLCAPSLNFHIFPQELSEQAREVWTLCEVVCAWLSEPEGIEINNGMNGVFFERLDFLCP